MRCARACAGWGLRPPRPWVRRGSTHAPRSREFRDVLVTALRAEHAEEAARAAAPEEVSGWAKRVSAGGGEVRFEKAEASGWTVTARFHVSPPAAMPRGLVEDEDVEERLLCLVTLAPPAAATAAAASQEVATVQEDALAPAGACDALSVHVWVYPRTSTYVLQDYTVHPPCATDVTRHLYFTTACVDSARDPVPFSCLSSTQERSDHRTGGFRFLEERLAERGVHAGFFVQAAAVVKSTEQMQYAAFLQDAADVLAVGRMSCDASVPLTRFIVDVVDPDWAVDTVAKPDDLTHWLPSDAAAEETPLDALQGNKAGIEALSRAPPSNSRGQWSEFGIPSMIDDQ